jgi:hypothetical protein
MYFQLQKQKDTHGIALSVCASLCYISYPDNTNDTWKGNIAIQMLLLNFMKWELESTNDHYMNLKILSHIGCDAILLREWFQHF